MNDFDSAMASPQEHEEILFELALEKPANERGAFLDSQCAGDAALRQRLENLLAAAAQPDDLTPQVTRPPSTTLKIDPPPDDFVGRVLGPYKLLERLGEGGCGVVYVAEQSQPIRRRVALKVIKLGMDTRQVIARFEAERQALAMMDHPNIARVLDAGATETGRPYFVMELVRGTRITEYFDDNRLPTRDRIELFIKVCQAIQHAHQKGIIHRDIKPSNILVTLHDGVPVPKVIDFGIAKAIDGKLTDKTVYTQLTHFVGTPAYMSPEQAEMTGLDIDTRSDIYSLGVLLYELLAGSTPFDAAELASQSLDQMRKTIRESEPARPSTRLATLKGEELTRTTQRRSVDRAKLLHQLKGDLDWIVMKCLEKDRSRRYETASGLAADLRRYLGNEPVTARPPSALYRFRKAFRRNKLFFTAVAAVTVALVLGIVASFWQSLRATQAERIARRAEANETIQRQQADASREQALAAEANEARLRQSAEAEALAARQRAYGADMNAAGQALEENNFGRALELLNLQRPAPGQADLRGWEWRYLWRQTRSDARSTLCQEPSAIVSLAASPDGKLLAVGHTVKYGLSVWDLATRQDVLHLGADAEEVHAAFSPVDPLIAFTSGTRSASGELHFSLRLWNTATRQMAAEIPLDGDLCKGVVFSADGHTVATIGFSGLASQITLWSVPTGARLASFPTKAGQNGSMDTCVAISPDLTLAAFGTQDNRVAVMDLRTGETRWSQPVKSGYVIAVAFSPDGRTLASGEGFDESSIRLWNVAGGAEIGTLAGHGLWVNSLVFSADGKTLASASADQTIRIWDVPGRTCVDVLHGHTFGVWRLAWLPDGKTLASGCKNGTVCLWDTSVRHPRPPRVTIPGNVYNWCFATDSQSIVTCDWNGEVTRWAGAAFQRGEPIMNFGSNYDLTFYANSVFSNDRRLLANGSTNGVIRIWDLSRATLLRQITNTADQVVPVKFLANGRRLVTASKTGWTLREWDLATGRELQSWTAPANEINVAKSSDDNSVVAFANTGRMQFHDLATGRQVETNLNFLEAYAASFSPSGQTCAVASTAGYVRAWETTSWRELKTVNGFLSGVNSLDFSPDGSRLAAGSGLRQAVSVFDTASWQNVFTLAGEGAGYANTAFSPDGNCLGSVNADGNLQIWRAPSWTEIELTEAEEKAEARLQ